MWKWIGTGILLVGVAMNILNNPALQEYIYPYNLVLNFAGSSILCVAAIYQSDRPYTILNGALAVAYGAGVIHAVLHFFPTILTQV